jgi:excisionase family DNA binding protein
MTVKEGEFLDPQGLADLFGIAVRTVYNWRSRQEGPRGYRIGGQVRYRRAEVEQWLQQQADEPQPAA